MGYTDLREWLEAAEHYGQLKCISGARWELEMSGIFELIQQKHPYPGLVLFDDIPGYPKGYRTLFGLLGSAWGIAKILNLPEDQLERMALLRNWRNKAKDLHLIPPKFLASGPVQENVVTGEQIDVFRFPSPRFHEMDTEYRYIGTADCVIQREPDTGLVNVGTYRVMMLDRNRLTVKMIEGQHGSMIMHDKYFARGSVMPIAIAVGADPALYWASAAKIPWGVSEYDYAGGIKGEPIDVIEGPYTGLPLPARAEIVIEGECHPGDLADEGPFGEWHGYYANLGLEPVPEPVIQVKAIYHRDAPILTCAHETVPPHDDCLGHALSSSEMIWHRMEADGIPGIEGVWCHEVGSGRLFNVIAIKQLYAGHARKAGLIASQLPSKGRYTIVVEEDIDPSNLEQVIWAIITRSLPDQAIQILPRCLSGSADPAIPPEEKRKYKVAPRPLYGSRVLIDACRGLEWKEDWYPIAKVSPELRARIIEKWQPILPDLL